MGSGIPLRLDFADMICQPCSHVSQQCRYRSVVTSQHLKPRSRSSLLVKSANPLLFQTIGSPKVSRQSSPTVIAVNKKNLQVRSSEDVFCMCPRLLWFILTLMPYLRDVTICDFVGVRTRLLSAIRSLRF